MKLAFALVVAVTLSACGTTVKHVQGPDGEDARLINCFSTADCYTKAARICPGGYVIRSNSMTLGAHAAGTLSRSEVLISCKDDLPDAPSAAAPSEHVGSRSCEMAFERAGDFATYWADHTPNAKRLDQTPSQRDFVTVCHEMPERVQRCFHAGYRAANAKACDAVLLRLDATERAKVDGLFLDAPSAEPRSERNTEKVDGGAI